MWHKNNFEDLEKPDAILQRNIILSVENPCKVFMMLELELIPVRYVIMQKRMFFFVSHITRKHQYND